MLLLLYFGALQEVASVRKKLFVILLAVCLFAGLIPTAANAQVIDKDGYSFDTETGALHIRNDAGSTQWRSDPDIKKEDVKSVTFQRLDTPVLNLGESAFEGCVNLTGTIKINADATSIGVNAFKGCDKVDLILIPEGARADIETAGIPEQTAYVVYKYDKDTDGANFFVQDVRYGSETQIVFDGYIFDGVWSCGVILVCEDKFNVVPASGETAWYYHTEDDGEITVTKYITEPSYRQTITLPKNFGDLVVKQYADDAFSFSGLTAQNIIVVEEDIKATIPEEISKLVVKTENGDKVAYLTSGTSGSIEDSLHLLTVPRDVSTLFMKDITTSMYDLRMMEGAVVSYSEDAGGNIIITNVLLSHFMMEQEYVVPATVENKPVTTVMINAADNYEIEKIVVDGSVNKILYESDPRDDSDSCTITQIVQGNQTGVELPLEITGKPVESIPETAFDESVESIVVPEELDVTQPEDVCKIVYTIDANGKVIITDIIPGTDETGNIKPVTVSNSIAGQTPVFSDAVKEEMVTIPHKHAGGTATCVERAECQICGQPYGQTDEANHGDLIHVVRKEPTCTTAGNNEYWTCRACDKFFGDAEGRNVIPRAETVIAAKGHNYENGKCTVCGTIDSGFQPAITTGADTWQEGSKDGLSFTSNADFADFIKVQVDGKDLAPSNYTVKEGSTIVTLKAEYLETLSAGKHTLAIVSDTGTATAEFTIEAASADDNTTVVPPTGDNSNVDLWIALMLVSVCGISMATVYSRRKKYNH